jgi:hypothetical protein
VIFNAVEELRYHEASAGDLRSLSIMMLARRIESFRKIHARHMKHMAALHGAKVT